MKTLRSCRVLDLGIITAGAATSAVLADLGAEVIKIESPTYRDPFRTWSMQPAPGEAGDLPPFFRMTNRGKLGASIDLKSAAGREVFLRLVSKSDVVVENFRRGVLDRLGLGFAALKAANPRIILASISSQGEAGPDAGYVSFGSTLEAMGGLAWITGYRDGPPTVSGIELNFPDQVVAIFAAAMIVTAWRAREKNGVHLDLSQRELTSFLCGEAFLEKSAAMRSGNAQRGTAVQDCYRSADGVWLAITGTDARRVPLADLVGAASGDAAVLSPALTAWVKARPAEEAVRTLRAHGIAVEPALDGNGVLAEQEHAWSWALQRLADGSMAKGFPFADDAAPLSIGRPAPALGADTESVLRDIGGYSDAEIAQLLAQGVIESAHAGKVFETPNGVSLAGAAE